MNKKLFTSLLFAFAAFAASAANSYFVGSCDRDALAYKVGEPMKFSINCFGADGKPAEGVKLAWTCAGDDGKKSDGSAVSSKKPLEISTSVSRPGFVRVIVTAVDDEGKPLHGFDKYEGGAGADVSKLAASSSEPADFDAFWRKQLDALAKVPMNAQVKPLKSGNAAFNLYELTLDCVGKPAKAYMSIPKDAAKKSLPLSIFVSGYGVSRIKPPYTKGAISISVARHSYELGQSDEYYKEQKKILGKFGLLAKDNADPENCYFKFMILRDIRAIQYAKTLPEWNGKDITVHGGSMGGFQSLFIAALDKDITKCDARIPWMCNLGGAAAGYQDSYFRPEFTPSILYFDSTNAAKRIKCPVDILARLGDYCCPPSGIMMLYNSLKCPAKIIFEQNGTHGRSSAAKGCSTYKLSK